MSAGDVSKADGERLEKIVEQLSEYFDSVQIFVSRYDGSNGLTVSASHKAGSWFSRYGQIREWLLYQDELIRCKARGDSEQLPKTKPSDDTPDGDQ